MSLADTNLRQAISRLHDKRHWFGASTKKVVEAFFAGPEYIGQPKRIKRFAKWAIEANGPAWYESPSPRGLLRGEAGYSVRVCSSAISPCR